jgi:hypothetical protein
MTERANAKVKCPKGGSGKVTLSSRSSQPKPLGRAERERHNVVRGSLEVIAERRSHPKTTQLVLSLKSKPGVPATRSDIAVLRVALIGD